MHLLPTPRHGARGPTLATHHPYDSLQYPLAKHAPMQSRAPSPHGARHQHSRMSRPPRLAAVASPFGSSFAALSTRSHAAACAPHPAPRSTE
jgi:hypothetical protein